MLLHDTPYETIWSVIEKERPKVRYQLDRFEASIIKRIGRRFVPGCHIPYVFTTEYTVPGSKNTYVIWVHVEPDGITAKLTSTTGSALALTQRDGSRNYFCNARNRSWKIPGNLKEQMFVITAHCLSRYRTRYVKTSAPSPNELLAEFIITNIRELQRFPLDWANLNHEAYEDGAAYLIRNGVILGASRNIQCGDEWVCVNQFNTFLPDKMLKKTQRDNIRERHIEYIHKLVDQFFKSASEEEINKVLNQMLALS